MPAASGLAAPQVGVLRRVCVVMNEDEDIIELVNPEIIAAEGEQTGLEGCLSIPGKFGIVTRPYTVRVRAQDRDGNFFEVEDEELTARCFCHEIEHLDGHLFVEHTDHLMTEEELEEYMNRQEEDERMRILFMGTPDFAVACSATGWWRTATRYAACLPSRISPRTGAMKLACLPGEGVCSVTGPAGVPARQAAGRYGAGTDPLAGARS